MSRAGSLALALVVSLVGCSSKTPATTVKGRVTLDGAAVENGMINFVSPDGSAATAEAKIEAGQYEAAVSPGERRVEIRAPKVVGKKKMYETADSPTVDVVEELVPRRYNAESTLTLTIAEGEQVKDFELTSK